MRLLFAHLRLIHRCWRERERESERKRKRGAPPPLLQAGRVFKPPAGPEGKHGRFKGKYVNGKTAGQMIKIMEFPGENGRVDRYE